jgi:hypothetical protein
MKFNQAKKDPFKNIKILKMNSVLIVRYKITYNISIRKKFSNKRHKKQSLSNTLFLLEHSKSLI